MLEFLKFWWSCLVEGVHVADGIFGVIEGICIFIGAGFHWRSHIPHLHNLSEKWEKWEGRIMKWAFAIAIGSFLISTIVVAPFLKFEEKESKPEKPQLATEKTAPPKPLPEKTIPASEFQPAKTQPNEHTDTPAEQSGATKSITNLETFGPTTNSGSVDFYENFLARKRAEVETQKAQEEKQKVEAENQKKEKAKQEQDWWDGERLFYNYAITVLRDKLNDMASKSGDGIAQSESYLQCLPANVPPKNETQLALIRLQNRTNISFLISAKQNAERRNDLLLDGSAASLNIHADSTAIGVIISIPAININEDKVVPLENGKSLIDERIDFLIESQKRFSETANKSDTKILDGRK